MAWRAVSLGGCRTPHPRPRRHHQHRISCARAHRRTDSNAGAPHRVEPIYPPFAVNAHLQGVVILEALVDEDGTVLDVKVLRSPTALLDNAALTAVRQWRAIPHAPCSLNEERSR